MLAGACNDFGEEREQPVSKEWQGERLGTAAAQEGIVAASAGFPGVQGVAQGVRGGLGVDPTDIGVDGFRRTAASQSDHGGAAGQGLDGDDPEVLLAGEEQGSAASVMISDHVVGLPAQEPNAWPGHCLQPCALGAFADDGQPTPGLGAGHDCLIDPLIRH